MLLAVFDLPPIVLVPPAPISRPSNQKEETNEEHLCRGPQFWGLMNSLSVTGKRLMLMKRVRTVTAAAVLQTVAVALEDLAGRNHQ
jgi:hypothetical protein